MDFLDTILWPIKWVIELILVAFHTLWTWLGMPPGDGWTWILSLVGLVIVVRSAMIPLMVRQIKSQRSMLEAAPEIKKIQDKYKGKKDQFSVEAMRRETMEVYQRTGSNPMSSCWPMLVQMPIFFALFRVINQAQSDQAGVGMMNAELAHHFANADIFGAPLSATLINNEGNVIVVVIAVVLVIVMTASQFFMQRQIMSKNVSPATKESPMYRQQQMLLYALPLVFAVSGVAFPIGLMMYWTISNFWTVGQQWITIRNMPTPGSEAAKIREERLKRRGKWVEPDAGDDTSSGNGQEPTPSTTQRPQPMSKARAKKQTPGSGKKPDATATPSAAGKDEAVGDAGSKATSGSNSKPAAGKSEPRKGSAGGPASGKAASGKAASGKAASGTGAGKAASGKGGAREAGGNGTGTSNPRSSKTSGRGGSTGNSGPSKQGSGRTKPSGSDESGVKPGSE
ncbi:membrane protein insertase YidC [Pseudoclavibacter endophyticus]|uniref:Membrane protein insertase YidC n=1 Tax=Pseudoclavibacter endophyticus TaxID=1778590 RepID=A0A6H9WP28_9MICO|nr:membrane protein insertase YidC [Pseudoclavibacter endophyticus]KAB1648777.1 membrane protein insertase YidC [Pseudoclavibacter endophyticus]GGA68591.1 membrane protein insertase YidC [Pseudoclavibacter endophyticus]